jgi:hypothetical protein
VSASSRANARSFAACSPRRELDAGGAVTRPTPIYCTQQCCGGTIHPLMDGIRRQSKSTEPPSSTATAPPAARGATSPNLKVTGLAKNFQVGAAFLVGRSILEP